MNKKNKIQTGSEGILNMQKCLEDTLSQLSKEDAKELVNSFINFYSDNCMECNNYEECHPHADPEKYRQI